MRDLQIRYLVRKVKRNKRGVIHEWWYWQPPKRIQTRYGLKPKRLAKNAPANARPEDIRRAAIDEAERLNAEYDRLRKDQPKLKPVDIPGTLPWLVARFKTTLKYTELAQSTRDRTYDCWWRLLERWSERLGHPPVKSMTRGVITELYEQLSAQDPETGKRQLARAKNIMASLRRILAYAYDLEIIDRNPALKMEMADAPERETIASEDKILEIMAKAAETGLPSIGLAARLAADTGLRRLDLLNLQWESFADDALYVVPHKTKEKSPELFPIPLTDESREMLMAIRQESGPIIVSEKTGRAFTPDNFTHRFREIADEAGLIGLWFHDLRRTAIVTLARASCTVPEIAAVTGHSVAHCHKILKRYLPRDRGTAQNAIDKLKIYRRRVGTVV